MSASLASPRKVFGECRRVLREREFASTRQSAQTKVCRFMHKKHILYRQTRQIRQIRITLAKLAFRESGESLQNSLANVGESGEYSQSVWRMSASLASLAYF